MLVFIIRITFFLLFQSLRVVFFFFFMIDLAVSAVRLDSEKKSVFVILTKLSSMTYDNAVILKVIIFVKVIINFAISEL